MFRVSVLCVLAAVGLPSFAQQTVKLYVAAVDKSGKPVTGLQQQDFAVIDNKQPQTILSFQAVGPASTGDDAAEIVLVLDAVNTDFTRTAFARQQMDNFLHRDGGRLSQPVALAIFSDSGLNILPGASLDGNAIANTLDQHLTGLRASNRSQGFYGAADRSGFSVQALQELAAYEQNRPGRKIVIWVSPGWALITGPRIELTGTQEKQIFGTLVGLTSTFQQAGITLYAVNPLGNTEALTRTFYYESFLGKVTKPSQTQFADLSLQVLAVHSGGLVLNGSNDIAGEIERCARDANRYYVLTFEPPAADGPNFYNTIAVKLARPGLKAQTISGFYSQPAPTGTH